MMDTHPHRTGLPGKHTHTCTCRTCLQVSPAVQTDSAQSSRSARASLEWGPRGRRLVPLQCRGTQGGGLHLVSTSLQPITRGQVPPPPPHPKKRPVLQTSAQSHFLHQPWGKNAAHAVCEQACGKDSLGMGDPKRPPMSTVPSMSLVPSRASNHLG